MERSEIRDSVKIELLDKVRKHDYGKYLLKTDISKIRGFSGETITFDFPVTALIGPNGSGKSSILGAAACAYKSVKPSIFFPKSAIGDNSMSGWRAEYEAIDKLLNPRQTVRRNSNFKSAKWVRSDVLDRSTYFFGIERTVPAGEKTKYKKLMRSTYKHTGGISLIDTGVAKQVEHVLGKDVHEFRVARIESNDDFLVGRSGGVDYSEFHFGAGESSVIRMIQEIEAAPSNALILIEEIENGLHPIATRRMVEYLMDVAKRKGVQSIFTTHSDYALDPLPNEAIWACINGKLKQGKLSVEALRAVSGRVDKEVAIFVEDVFAKKWVDAILREKLGEQYSQVEVYSVAGDGNAVNTHISHRKNPSISFRSICVIDGDSSQNDDHNEDIYRLPGEQPELSVYEDILGRIEEQIAILTVSCQRAPESQETVKKKVNEIIKTNRDPHLLFNQLGIAIGFVSEDIVRGAFLSLWIRNNEEYCNQFASVVRRLLGG
ncbi:ATP-dependent nuclease [Shewanella algae]|uniref:ATP-dependent nuclease n=1 Tax=Shewanella algae TaxID=38313 RepID=UPI001AADE7BF|nr:AAA family ATPase [Shewanella algae]MBO2598660.1 AAA family ATPase [Shewanella algae]